MSHYKPYPAYRDSGVEWIGQVPKHWRVSAVKREFDTQLGKMLQPEQKSPSDIPVPYHKAVSVQWENVADIPPETMWASPSEQEQYRIRKGDLLICEGGDVGRAALFVGEDAEPVIIQNSIHRVRAKHGNNNELLLRVMQTVKRSGWFDVLCSKATIVHFTSEKLGDLAYPVAPQEESKAIVSTVRREVARIDALITKKTRFIELLKEKRQALITHAVTKGLDADAPMRDSDVEWIGKVPEHWVLSRLGHFATVENGTTPSKENAAFWDNGTIPWVGSGEVNQGVVTEPTAKISDLALRTCSLRLLPIDTVIVGMVGQGKTRGLAAILKIEATINQNLAAICTGPKLRPMFLLYVFKAAYEWLREAGRGSNQSAMNCEIVGEFRLPLPAIEEQDQILLEVERTTSRIDLLTEKTQRSIDLLKERRAAFITAAVTGQIDLRESA